MILQFVTQEQEKEKEKHKKRDHIWLLAFLKVKRSKIDFCCFVARQSQLL